MWPSRRKEQREASGRDGAVRKRWRDLAARLRRRAGDEEAAEPASAVRRSSPGRDDRTSVLVLAGDPHDRAAAIAALRTAGFQASAAPEPLHVPSPAASGRPERHDAALLLPRGSAVDPSVAAARVRATAPGRALAVAIPAGMPLDAALAASLLGPGTALVRWPASSGRLRSAIDAATGAAAGARSLAAAGAPGGVAAGIEQALVLAGPQGHPQWFLEALLGALDLPGGGGAVVLPATRRVAAACGLTPAQVVRALRRTPPPPAIGAGAVHARLDRPMRSSSARLRELRGWWWLPGPPCAGPESTVLLVHGRLPADRPWIAAAMDVVAGRLSRCGERVAIDPVTGIEPCDAAGLSAAVCEAVAGLPHGWGACVLRVALEAIPAARRDRGPRAEARAMAAAARIVVGSCRPSDAAYRTGAHEFAVVAAARDRAAAERIRIRLEQALGRNVLTRRDDAPRGGVPSGAAIRCVFVPAPAGSADVAAAIDDLGFTPPV